MVEATTVALANAGIGVDDVTFVAHQANARIIEAAARCSARPRRRSSSTSTPSPTPSASIPIALWQAEKEGKPKPGDVVAMATFGAAFAWVPAPCRGGSASMPPPRTLSPSSPGSARHRRRDRIAPHRRRRQGLSRWSAPAVTSRPTSAMPTRCKKPRQGRAEHGPICVLVNNAGERRDGLTIG